MSFHGTQECKFCVTVANPHGEDFPLIAVSEEFETMTGYTRNEILGVNCRFLNQGVDMNPQETTLRLLKRSRVVQRALHAARFVSPCI